MALAQAEGPAANEPRGETLEELFLALETPLLCYAQRLAASPDLAEDLVQEAFMRLQTHWNEVKSPRSWLYRTVHNLALNQRRGSGKIVPLPGSQDLQPELPDVQPLPDEELARLEGIGLVLLNLKGLEPRAQEIIRLKFEENLSYQQISERTGVTVSNVGYLLHHSLKTLSASLARAGLVP